MNRDQHQGFTLVELLIAFALMGTLLALALPSFGRFQENKRVLVSRDLLTSHIQQTRVSAINSGRPHQLCGSSDGEKCDGDWGSYWLITTVGKTPSVLRQQAAPSSSICRTAFGGTGIRFHPNGTSGTSNGKLTICNINGPHHVLTLNRQGRLKVEESHNSGCC